jgi:hypothetical protein
MNKADVVALLGEPTRMYRAGVGPRMLSNVWLCAVCYKLHSFPEPVEPPAPCQCGSIAFEKKSD